MGTMVVWNRRLFLSLVVLSTVATQVGAQTPGYPTTLEPSTTSSAPSATSVEPAPAAFPAPNTPQSASAPIPEGQTSVPPTPTPSSSYRMSPTPAPSHPSAVSAVPQPTHALADEQQTSPSWSAGAGIGYPLLGTSYGAFPSEYVGSLRTPAPSLIGDGGMANVATPSPVAFLERRVAKGVYALCQAEGTYTKTTDQSLQRDREQIGFSIGPGIRWVLNSGAPVEVGMAHIVYYAREKTTSTTSETDLNDTPTTSTSRITSRAFGAATALVVERELMPRLWLRVGATFLRAYSSKTTVSYESDTAGASETGATSGGVRLGFEPSLTMRIAF